MLPLNKLRLFFGLFDQGIISVSNLVMGLLLINYVDKAEYGVYVIANAGILLLLGFSNALINTQMSVNYADKKDGEQYCKNMFSALLLLVVSFAILFFLISFVAQFLGFVSLATVKVLYAVSFATTGVLLHEFIRRYYLLSSDTVSVLLIDGLYLVLMFAGLFYLANYYSDDLYINVIYVYGLSTLIVAIFSLACARLLRIQKLSIIKATLKESWLHGKWALSGVMVTWLQNQSYIFLLAIMVTAEGVAEANASRLFLSPMALIIMSLSKIFLPRMAVLKKERGSEQVVKYANTIILYLSILVLGYGFIMYYFSPYLVEKLMSTDYKNIDILILVWVAVFFMQAFRVNYSTVLQSLKEFKFITSRIFVSSILVLLISLLLISKYGVMGSIVSLLFGELLLAYMLFRKIKYEK